MVCDLVLETMLFDMSVVTDLMVGEATEMTPESLVVVITLGPKGTARLA